MGSVEWLKSILPNLAGEEGLVGFFFGYIEGIGPGKAYTYIVENRPLVNAGKMKHFRGFADQIKYLEEYRDARAAIKKLAEERPDLASVFLNHPEGVSYLQRQINTIIDALSAEEVVK